VILSGLLQSKQVTSYRVTDLYFSYNKDGYDKPGESFVYGWMI
jgi:hypothetical protein